MEMNHIISKLLSKGVQAEHDEIQARKVRFMNGMLWCSFIAVVLLAVAEVSEGKTWVMPIHGVRISAFAIAMHQLWRGRYIISIFITQYTLLGTSIAGTFIAPYINSFHFLAIPLCTVWFYLMGNSLASAVFFLINILYFVLAEYYNMVYQPLELTTAYFISFVIIFGLFFVLMSVYLWEHRALERVVGAKNEQMSEINAELEVQNVMLADQNSQLEASDRLKNSLLTIISHDLKSPFSNIVGFADLLNSKFSKNSVEKNEYLLDLLQTSVHQTSLLLDDFLYWASCQTNNIKVSDEEVELTSIFKELETMYNHNIVSKRLTVVYDKCHQLVIRTDKTLLTIVVRNLFAKALKYSPAGGEIMMRAEGNGHRCVISIRDSGIGIKKEVLQNLNQSLHSSSTPGTYNEKGHGLGLITCLELVKRINGEIHFAAEEGDGTTAKVVLRNAPCGGEVS